MKVMLQSNGSAEQTTGALFLSLRDRLSEHGLECHLVLRSLPKGVGPKLRSMGRLLASSVENIRNSDVLLVHSALSLSLPDILIAKVMRKKVIAFVWDIYPASTIEAGNLNNPAARVIYGLTEWFGLRAADRILVPSSDYLPYLSRFGYKSAVHPLWASAGLQETRIGRSTETNELRLVFAGQINAIRGIEGALTSLCEALPNRVITLDVFSKDGLPDEVVSATDKFRNLRVSHRGFVPQDKLAEELGSFDFGLVALSPEFTLPSFPSKIMAYISTGLPVLYWGPSRKGLIEALDAFNIGVHLEENSFSADSLSIEHDAFLTGRSRYFEEILSCERDLVEFIYGGS